MSAQRTESHLIWLWPCGANVILKWALDKFADWRRARMICLTDFHPRQILLEMQLSIHRWSMVGFFRSAKKDDSDYFLDFITIFCFDQTENISYSVTE